MLAEASVVLSGLGPPSASASPALPVLRQVVGLVTRKDLTNINIHRKLDPEHRDSGHHDEEHGGHHSHDPSGQPTPQSVRATHGVSFARYLSRTGRSPCIARLNAACVAVSAQVASVSRRRSSIGLITPRTNPMHPRDEDLIKSHGEAIESAGLDQGVELTTM